MLKLYHGFLRLALGLFPLAARFNPKLQSWLDGRKNWEAPLLSASLKPGCVWFHAASTGEFEQAIPLIEWLKLHRPNQHFVISFFSPSGYSVYHQYPGAAAVFYLPADFPTNNERLLDLVQPASVIFIKYEIWPSLFHAIKSRKIPLALVAARFHPKHFLLKKSMKGFLAGIIEAVNVVGAQDNSSVSTMRNAGFKQVEWCGDTRFDRVLALRSQKLPEELRSVQEVNLVAGSTWEKDDLFLAQWLETADAGCRLLVFPHELDDERLKNCVSIYQQFGAELWKGGPWPDARVVVVGLPKLLSRAYRLGKAAWIGGGFDKGGIHNCLEAAVYNIPVFFGPVYQAYPEAVGLVEHGGGRAITSPGLLTDLIGDAELLQQMAKRCEQYIEINQGATERTVQLLKQHGFFG